jgi:hypothetical protein
VILRSDQPALYMSAAVPAPAEFQVLRDYLEKAQIDVNHLCFQLEQFLQQPEHLPGENGFEDPHGEHQAWAYRQTVQEFIDMVQARPDAGNGDGD